MAHLSINEAFSSKPCLIYRWDKDKSLWTESRCIQSYEGKTVPYCTVHSNMWRAGQTTRPRR